MFRGLAVWIKRKVATDFSGSCGRVAKKRAPQAAPRGDLNVKLFVILSGFLTPCDTDQAEQTRAKQPDGCGYRNLSYFQVDVVDQDLSRVKWANGLAELEEGGDGTHWHDAEVIGDRGPSGGVDRTPEILGHAVSQDAASIIKVAQCEIIYLANCR